MDPIELEDITQDVYAGPFHDRQRGAGADFYEDLGNLWTRSFGDPVGEYWAVRRDVGLWDVSALVKWRFRGADALEALDRLTTRRMLRAEPGVIRYAMVLDEEGMMLDEGTACVVSGEEAWFLGNDDREPFEAHLRRFTDDLDVEIECLTQAMPNIAVQGPRSLQVVSALASVDVGSLGYFRMITEPIELAGVSGYLTRTGFTGEVGYEFFLRDPGDAERLWDAVLDAGARPFGLDAIELLRMELGLVIQEEDYFPGATSPFDLSLDRFVDLDGYGFIGYRAASEMAANPPRRFKTIVIEGDEVPQRGAPVTRDGDVAGVVTSAARSPRFGVIALAILRADAAEEGGGVEVWAQPGTVRSLPLDDQGRARSDPRAPATID